MTSHFVSLDQLRAAASFVAGNWGDHGYRVAVDVATVDGAVFLVRCSDGGEFRILVDRWGNASHPSQCHRGTIGCADESLTHRCAA